MEFVIVDTKKTSKHFKNAVKKKITKKVGWILTKEEYEHRNVYNPKWFESKGFQHETVDLAGGGKCLSRIENVKAWVLEITCLTEILKEISNITIRILDKDDSNNPYNKNLIILNVLY